MHGFPTTLLQSEHGILHHKRPHFVAEPVRMEVSLLVVGGMVVLVYVER